MMAHDESATTKIPVFLVFFSTFTYLDEKLNHFYTNVNDIYLNVTIAIMIA